jgi:hypothetical protein
VLVSVVNCWLLRSTSRDGNEQRNGGNTVMGDDKVTRVTLVMYSLLSISSGNLGKVYIVPLMHTTDMAVREVNVKVHAPGRMDLVSECGYLNYQRQKIVLNIKLGTFKAPDNKSGKLCGCERRSGQNMSRYHMILSSYTATPTHPYLHGLAHKKLTILVGSEHPSIRLRGLEQLLRL